MAVANANIGKNMTMKSRHALLPASGRGRRILETYAIPPTPLQKCVINRGLAASIFRDLIDFERVRSTPETIWRVSIIFRGPAPGAWMTVKTWRNAFPMRLGMRTGRPELPVSLGNQRFL